jgi:hypothetical protein
VSGFIQTFDRWNVRWTTARVPALLLTAGYCLLVGIALSQHEMWRDEIEAWLYARDSASLPQLFANLKNEGHPALWYLLLMPLTRLSRNPEAMQVLHLAIATTTVYLVSRHAPFSRLQVLLFPLGFYTAWQYAVVSRDYALGVLLLVSFCVLYPRRYERFPWIGLVLALAAHTHALVLILVMVIASALALDLWVLRREGRLDLTSGQKRGIALGFALILFGIATSLLQLVPDHHYAGPTDSAVRELRDHGMAIGALALAVTAALSFVLYRWRRHLAQILVYGLGAAGIALYTESSILGAIPGRPGLKVFALIGLAAYVWLLYQLRDRLSLLLLYGVGITGLVVFFTGIFSGGPHHYGMLFVIYVMGYWLERSTRSADPSPRQARQNRATDLVFTLMLVSQSLFGVTMLYQDLASPYSHGKSVARYIQARGWQDLPIVGCMDFSAQTVVGYLDAKRIYYPEGERWGSYIVWDQKRRENTGLDNCLKSAQSLGGDVVVVSSYREDGSLRNGYFDKVAEFTGALRDDENFIIYRPRNGRAAIPAPEPEGRGP